MILATFTSVLQTNPTSVGLHFFSHRRIPCRLINAGGCAGKVASKRASIQTRKRSKAGGNVDEEQYSSDEEEKEEQFDWPPLVCCFGEAHKEFIPTVRYHERNYELYDEDVYSSWKGLQWSPPEFVRAPGTSPSNLAVALARLNARVAFVGKVLSLAWILSDLRFKSFAKIWSSTI